MNNAEPGGGTYTLRSATWASVNAVFAQVINQVGPGQRRRGREADGDHEQPVARVLPADARRGRRTGSTRWRWPPATRRSRTAACTACRTRSRRIVGPDGKTMFRQKPRCHQAIPRRGGLARDEHPPGRPDRRAPRPAEGSEPSRGGQDGHRRELPGRVVRGLRPPALDGGLDGMGGERQQVAGTQRLRRHDVGARSGSASCWPSSRVRRSRGSRTPRRRRCGRPTSRTSSGRPRRRPQTILTAGEARHDHQDGTSNQPKGIIFKQSPGAGASRRSAAR